MFVTFVLNQTAYDNQNSIFVCVMNRLQYILLEIFVQLLPKHTHIHTLTHTHTHTHIHTPASSSLLWVFRWGPRRDHLLGCWSVVCWSLTAETLSKAILYKRKLPHSRWPFPPPLLCGLHPMIDPFKSKAHGPSFCFRHPWRGILAYFQLFHQ